MNCRRRGQLNRKAKLLAMRQTVLKRPTELALAKACLLYRLPRDLSVYSCSKPRHLWSPANRCLSEVHYGSGNMPPSSFVGYHVPCCTGIHRLRHVCTSVTGEEPSLRLLYFRGNVLPVASPRLNLCCPSLGRRPMGLPCRNGLGNQIRDCHAIGVGDGSRKNGV